MLYTKYLLILTLLSMFYCCVNGVNKTNRRTRNSQQTSVSGQYSSVNASTTHSSVSIKKKKEIDIKKKASTKKDWVFEKHPRSGVMIIRTKSETYLHPGELNVLRNAVSMNDLCDHLFIQFPYSILDAKYTVVLYTDGYIAEALANVNAKDLLNGISNDSCGDVLAELNPDEIWDMTTSPTKYCIEVFLQKNNHLVNPVKDRYDWKNIEKQWKSEMAGIASKTCFTLLPDGTTKEDLDISFEFAMILENFEKELKLYKLD
ncbi:uncharacterized protein LOC142327563 [Lycorma delicatula]|uniref:uncharacterized protein LOC142327563 n=1 Tax=Lycorma delicatula TaxID=130591 RepID=UPI003F51512A